MPMLQGKQPFDPHALFQANIDGIQRCDVVVAVLDGPDADSGTAWECGYAHKLKRPVVGIRTDLRAGGDDPRRQINLMLSQACSAIIMVPLSKRDDDAWLTPKVVDAVTQSAIDHCRRPKRRVLLQSCAVEAMTNARFA